MAIYSTSDLRAATGNGIAARHARVLLEWNVVETIQRTAAVGVACLVAGASAADDAVVYHAVAPYS